MTYKQLLELAAHAAGFPTYTMPNGSMKIEAGYGVFDTSTRRFWNPLSNSADAFCLMVDLNLNVFCMNGKAYAMDLEADHEQQVEIGGDKYAAMRRAILQCAASIGKQMVGV